MDSNTNKGVKVLTAGGAAAGGRGKNSNRKNKRRNKGKNKPKQQPASQPQQPTPSTPAAPPPPSYSDTPPATAPSTSTAPAAETPRTDVDLSFASPPPVAPTETAVASPLSVTSDNIPKSQNNNDPETPVLAMEMEEPALGGSGDEQWEDVPVPGDDILVPLSELPTHLSHHNKPYSDHPGVPPASLSYDQDASTIPTKSLLNSELVWLLICFLGIMASFVCYGLLMEYTTSGGRQLHELSFLFVTSGLYTLTAAAGRYVRDETPTTIPPARFAVLGLTSMGSTFCSVRSLRYVIYPIQVLAKSCKPVPVMIMGALMGKQYPWRKYVNVVMIVLGVALFMGGGDNKSKKGDSDEDDSTSSSSSSQLFGILLLFISLCFDGGTGAYEDKLMSVHSVQPFDLMYNIQLGKTLLAGIGLLVFNQIHIFLQMVREMGFLLVALGLSGALGQVFIFVTIAKFGALTCSIIGLSRKVTTLVASIYFYGHHLNSVQFSGLLISITAMVLNFWGKKKGGGGGHGHGGPAPIPAEEMEKMLVGDEDIERPVEGDVELQKQEQQKLV